MNSKKIYLSPPLIDKEELKSIKSALKSNWIAPIGPCIDNFENDISNYLNVKYCAAVSSGTAALHLALKVLNINEGDYVFCSDLTFVASANAIKYVNAIPVFIDSNLSTWNMCPKSLEKAFTDFSPKAVIITNIYGQSADYESLIDICKKNKTPIIEDAAESLGADYKNKKCGSFGDLSILSFNGNKIITTSSGGMIVSNNEFLIEKAKKLSTQAREDKLYYHHKEIGFNYRMSNILASIGIAQLKKLDAYVNKTRKIFNYYKTSLEHYNCYKFMPEIIGGRSTNWLTVLLLKTNDNKKIKKIIKSFLDHNIEVRPIWKPMHLQPIYKNEDFYFFNRKPISKYLFENGICLPSGVSLDQNDQDKIINILIKYS